MLVLACGPAAPAPSVDPPPPGAGPADPGIPAWALLGTSQMARREAAQEVVAIALALPPGARDPEAAWLLEAAAGPVAAPLIEALELAEILRCEAQLLVLAARPEAAVRDPALFALASAGVLDVQPLVASALRTEASESSLAAIASAAGLLGPLVPVAAIKTALARARTAPTLVAITEALGPELDADAVRILAAKGTAGRRALDRALSIIRGAAGRALPPSDRPAHAVDRRRSSYAGAGLSACGPAFGASPDNHAAIAALHARADEVIAADALRDAVLTTWLGDRLRGGGPGAVVAAAALGRIASPRAALVLATALDHVHGEVAGATSAALTAVLQVAPTRRPEGARELRRAWFPVLATLVPDAARRGQIDPK